MNAQIETHAKYGKNMHQLMQTVGKFKYESLPEKYWCIILKHYKLFLIAAAAGIIVYGAEIFNFSLSIDEEVSLVEGNRALVTHVQRWGILLLQGTIFPTTLIPFFSPLYTILLLSIFSCILLSIFDFTEKESILFVVLLMSFPQFAYQMQFSYQSPFIAFGYILCALAFKEYAAFISDNNKIHVFFFCLFATIAIGIYQSFIFFLPLLFIMKEFYDLYINKTQCKKIFTGLIKRAGCMIFLLFISLIICIFISKCYFGNVTNEYFIKNIAWLTHPYHDVLRYIANVLFKHFFGLSYFGEKIFLLASASFFLLSVFFLKPPLTTRAILLLIFILAIAISPFLHIFIFGHDIIRTLLGQGIVFAFIVTICLSSTKAHKLFFLLIIVFSVLYSSTTVSRLFFQDTMHWRADLLLANRLISRIELEKNFNPDIDKLYIHGAPTLPNSLKIDNSDMFDTSFFTFDNGNIYRIEGFLRAHGIAKFYLPYKSEILERLPLIEKMPTWPHPQCMQKIDGLWVVKMGNRHGFIEDQPLFRR